MSDYYDDMDRDEIAEEIIGSLNAAGWSILDAEEALSALLRAAHAKEQGEAK